MGSAPTSDPVARALELFLDDANVYGCAETALVALQEHWALPDPADSSPAMALNGGVAYTGGMCGAITGAALAVGRLAARHVPDHRRAKRIAREIVQRLIDDFATRFGASDCRTLTGYDMRTDHAAFLASGVWRVSCMRQIEFAVEWLAELRDVSDWSRAQGTAESR